MQPGDLVPTFRGLACLAGEVLDFDSTTLNGLYTVLVFYEVLKVISHLILFSCVQGDFLLASTSFLRALATTLEGHCYLVAVSTDPVEAHRFFKGLGTFRRSFLFPGSSPPPLSRSSTSPWWRTRPGRSAATLGWLTRTHLDMVIK